MKNTIKELLKEMYLLQSAGGGGLFDRAIEIATDIHCELNGVDKEKYLNELQEIKDLAWKDQPIHFTEVWDKRQKLYTKLINGFLGTEDK